MEMAVGSIRAVVLAAGRSSRFKSKKSKQLFSLCGRPMVLHPLIMLHRLGIPTTVVVGNQADDLIAAVKSAGLTSVDFVTQHEQRGTGHAVLQSRSKWDTENILVLNGDAPLLSAQRVQELCEEQIAHKATASFLVAHATNPSGYGRVVGNGPSLRIVEHKACTTEELEVTLINAAIYLFKRDFLEREIEYLSDDNPLGEICLTDLIACATKKGESVRVVNTDYDSVRGVNTLEELWEVEQIKRSLLIKHWMQNGVRFTFPQTTHVDVDVTIGADTVIGAGVHLLGDTSVGNNCIVEPYVVLHNTHLADDVRILSHSSLYDSTIALGAVVGPFARLRGGTVLEKNTVVGNFVEVKKSRLADGTKAKHLAYLGDAHVGRHVNIGAGTITCNHDGTQKNTTRINDNAYVGSNSTLVAPLTLGKESFIAAGSTITKDVPERALAFGRSRQIVKEDYTQKMRRKSSAKNNQKSA